MLRLLCVAGLCFALVAACDSWLPTKAVMVACTTNADCPKDWLCAADNFCIGYTEDASPLDGSVGDAFVSDTPGVTSCAQGAACPVDKPICSGNVCVECADDSECRSEPSKPFCVSNKCASCSMAAPTACSTSTSGARPVCGAAGLCVQCQGDTDCKDPKASFCVSNQCKGCDGAVPGACGTRDAKLPACGPTGACVECDKDALCTDSAKPICSANACRKCAKDAECVAKLGADPGVCMAHDDGRCASTAETVFVENVTAKCMNSAAAGTAAVPYCGLQEGISAAETAAKALVVLRGPRGVFGASYAGAGWLAVVGQGSALISPGAATGLTVSGDAKLYARKLTIDGGAEEGVVVESGARVRLENVSVVNNKRGGILVNSATLILKDSIVSGNGPGDFMSMGILWGGFRMQNPLSGTLLERVTVTDNKNTGVSCSAAVQATGILTTGNVGTDISNACGFASCAIAGPTCGAQP